MVKLKKKKKLSDGILHRNYWIDVLTTFVCFVIVLTFPAVEDFSFDHVKSFLSKHFVQDS